jgi:Resolvase, N terminal domain
VRVGLYARVSTERQQERGTVASQLAVLRAAAEATGDEIVEEFVDDGYSGARLDRPALGAFPPAGPLRDGVLLREPQRAGDVPLRPRAVAKLSGAPRLAIASGAEASTPLPGGQATAVEDQQGRSLGVLVFDGSRSGAAPDRVPRTPPSPPLRCGARPVTARLLCGRSGRVHGCRGVLDGYMAATRKPRA